MSFWLDGNEEDADHLFDPMMITSSQRATTTTQQSQQQGHHGSQQQGGQAVVFVCEQCGGHEYEEYGGGDGNEENPNIVVCSNCYTEASLHPSQSQSSQLDYDEVMGLAAKTRGGGLVAAQKYKKRRGCGDESTYKCDPQKKLQSLEPLDQSVPLPDLLTCVSAFQTVLHECTERLVQLIHHQSSCLSSSAQSSSTSGIRERKRILLHETVRTLWSTYLKSYQQGAEHYGQLYPQVRFSLRDAFYSHPKYRKMIVDAVLYNATTKATAAAAESSGVHSRRNNATDDHDEDDIIEDEKEEGCDESSSSSRHRGGEPHLPPSLQQQVKRTPRRGTLPSQFLRRRCRKANRQTAMELALLTPPSMYLAASLLWLACYDSNSCSTDAAAAVSSHQMSRWIESGQLPLMNAYSALLTASQQRALRPIAFFFRLDVAPTPKILENRATHAAIACRMLQTHATGTSSGTETETDTGTYNGREEDRVAFVTIRSAPGILAQLVADLGLGQTVLDRCGKLLHSINHVQQEQHLRPKRLSHLVALVAISCWMEPDWRSWTYSRRRDDPAMMMIPPCNEAQLRLVRNGSELEGYLTFSEKIVLVQDDSYGNNSNSLARNFVMSLSENEIAPGSEDGDDDSNSPIMEEGRSSSKPAVIPCLDVCGVPLSVGEQQSKLHGGLKADDTTTSIEMHHRRARRRVKRSSRLESDPQALMLLEFLASSTKHDTSQIQSAARDMLLLLQTNKTPSGNDRKPQEKSKYRKNILKRS